MLKSISDQDEYSPQSAANQLSPEMSGHALLCDFPHFCGITLPEGSQYLTIPSPDTYQLTSVAFQHPQASVFLCVPRKRGPAKVAFTKLICDHNVCKVDAYSTSAESLSRCRNALRLTVDLRLHLGSVKSSPYSCTHPPLAALRLPRSDDGGAQ